MKISRILAGIKKFFGFVLGDLMVLRNAIAFLLILIELAVLYVVLNKFQIETELGFPRIIRFVLIGFVVNHFLPSKLRLPFFFLLFVGTAARVVGVQESLILTAIGLGLLFIAHLPLKYWLRVSAVCIVAIVLAALRMNWIPSSWGEKVVPILASMFMFRFILYLFELKKGTPMAGWWERITYFFLLPNLCFPLFPVIDYRTFLSTYYKESAYEIYQKGVRWMTWGTLHLLLYRAIYYFWVPAPADVVDLNSLFLYCFTSYMLVLKIAGQAYLILGILALFGWNLPTMFHLYYLASGFSDLWRRVTIYWKNFMMKVFYYPVYFAIRGLGLTLATMASLLIAFLLTWFLHSYQYFWIQGTFLVRPVDGIFWSIFGIAVAIDSFFQIRKKQRKSLGPTTWNLLHSVKHSSKVVFFFLFMCLLFSFWGSESISEWLTVTSVALEAPPSHWAILLGGILLALIVGTLVQIPFSRWKLNWFQTMSIPSAAILILASLGALLFIRLYRLDLPKKSAYYKMVYSLRLPGWNKRDAELAERGYYEPLLKTNMLSGELFQGRKAKPLKWHDMPPEIIKSTNDLLQLKLVPSSSTTFKNAPFSTNSHGMRDQEYHQQKPANTYRFALLGGSVEMGSGVADGEPFEAITEERLNQMDKKGGFSRYEILNFSVSGYDLIRSVKLCDTRVFSYQPDAVIAVVHTGTMSRNIRRLFKQLDSGINLEYNILKEIRDVSGYQDGMSLTKSQRVLRPYMDQLTEWSLTRIARRASANNSLPICLILPTIQMPPEGNEVAYMTDLATRIGFITIDLSDIFDEYDSNELMVAPWDNHPNAKGHQIIADALYEEMVKNADILKMIRSGSKMATTDFSSNESNR